MSFLSPRSVEFALYKAIDDLKLVPSSNVSYPNKRSTFEGFPRIVIDRPFVYRPLIDNKGQYSTEHGTITITIVVEKENSSKLATEMQDKLFVGLPSGHKVDVIPQGQIIFKGFPQEEEGYEDYGSWRLPVTLSYVANL